MNGKLGSYITKLMTTIVDKEQDDQEQMFNDLFYGHFVRDAQAERGTTRTTKIGRSVKVSTRQYRSMVQTDFEKMNL